MAVQVVGGRYELIRQIGAGGMGQVFEGFDRNLKRRIAVKLTQANLDTDPEWTKRFLREAELMATVSHPGTPAIYDAGTTEEATPRPFLVMEFVDGVTFDDLLARNGPLPIGAVAALGAQVAAVLAATHRHRIYHRDLKPSNLMLCHNGTVKVLDFGLAVALDSGLSRYTTTGQTIGTPAFMAPEQIESRDVTPQTDLYALGLIVHEMLTGERVFTGDNAYSVWTQQVSAAAPNIRTGRPDTPADMAGLIMCMLEKKPESRPAGAQFVHKVLMRHASDLGELVDDADSPARMYAVAVSAAAGAEPSAVIPAAEPDQSDENPSAGGVPTDDLSRGDLHRAIERARRLADDSRYHPAIRHLKTVVDAAVPVLGARDADVVDARIELAGLRFESESYAEAAELYRELIDDLTSERGPYDEQVMYCQRRLAECILHLGEKAEAVDRFVRLRGQMEARYGESDRRVVELAETIANIRA
ncbi:serine/threonine-protein kinase [Nocardia cyriacigeorgica]|uniref:serine/threonine-protein kinase n=1 Tax=Nocardia cyriacigeorgica TaxID=135487 RepID=UPI001895881A|nr:serine/threonine-protein kinase [Nocardia cyriacigeorgica]MBF6455524.1 serine/threonine protein kinase [Nocardia cyriacigeorgica]MBF6482264.1 serine/threonine protein kinase [Nocardia cyriacigeorgica]MBF6553734.1 serine/threonine protein kinase [Nocardia cyriacigeorgica]